MNKKVTLTTGRHDKIKLPIKAQFIPRGLGVTLCMPHVGTPSWRSWALTGVWFIPPDKVSLNFRPFSRRVGRQVEGLLELGAEQHMCYNRCRKGVCEGEKKKQPNKGKWLKFMNIKFIRHVVFQKEGIFLRGMKKTHKSPESWWCAKWGESSFANMLSNI